MAQEGGNVMKSMFSNPIKKRALVPHLSSRELICLCPLQFPLNSHTLCMAEEEIEAIRMETTP